jgi:hypothetical protein
MPVNTPLKLMRLIKLTFSRINSENMPNYRITDVTAEVRIETGAQANVPLQRNRQDMHMRCGESSG